MHGILTLHEQIPDGRPPGNLSQGRAAPVPDCWLSSGMGFEDDGRYQRWQCRLGACHRIC